MKNTRNFKKKILHICCRFSLILTATNYLHEISTSYRFSRAPRCEPIRFKQSLLEIVVDANSAKRTVFFDSASIFTTERTDSDKTSGKTRGVVLRAVPCLSTNHTYCRMRKLSSFFPLVPLERSFF